MIKHCVMTTEFDKRGMQKNKEFEFDTPAQADKFLKKLSKSIARQRYIKEKAVL